MKIIVPMNIPMITRIIGSNTRMFIFSGRDSLRRDRTQNIAMTAVIAIHVFLNKIRARKRRKLMPKPAVVHANIALKIVAMVAGGPVKRENIPTVVPPTSRRLPVTGLAWVLFNIK